MAFDDNADPPRKQQTKQNCISCTLLIPQNLAHREVEALVPHRLCSALGRLRDARRVAHREQAHRVSGRARCGTLQRLHAFNAPPYVFPSQQQGLTRIYKGTAC